MDEDLVLKAKMGNHEALAQLLYRNYEIVYKYLIKFVLNVNVAEDITQETMVRAIEKFDLYNAQKSKFSTWLITISQNLYMDHLRKVKRESKYIEGSITQEEDFIGRLSVQAKEYDGSWNAILNALSKLSEEIRHPVVLKHYYGYSLEEIASKMSIPLGTVKSRIHNGLKTLRKELE